MLSGAEKESRHKSVLGMMKANDLKALLLIGDTNVSWAFNGHFRYYTNNHIIFYRQVAVVFPDSEPVLFAGSEIQKQAAEQRSFMNDCRFSADLLVDLTKLLKERGVGEGRVGVNFEMLPASWHGYLLRQLPRIQFVETHEHLMEIRSVKSREEMDEFRRGAALADDGFEAAVGMARPGVSEYEIVAEIEHSARVRGAEDHFTLIGSGKFSFGDDNTLPLPYAPSHRTLEAGDSIIMEISPRHDGYWTQLVRTFNLGEPNTDLEKIHRVCRGALEKGLAKLRPGLRVKDVVSEMASYVSDSDYLLKPPLGHICDVDLIYDRVSQDNEMVLKAGTAVIIHPTIFTPDGKRSFFWGETYLVTQEGYERLHRATDEIITVEP